MYLTRINRSPFYQVIYKTANGWNTKSTGKTHKKDAIKFLNEFKNNATKKTSIGIEKNTKIKKSGIKLNDFLNAYREFKSILHSESYSRDIKYTFKLLIESVGNIPLEQLKKESLEIFLHKTYLTSPHAAALYYRTLKAAFSKAIEWNYISSNPLIKIKLPGIPKKYPVFIDASDLKLILEKTSEQIFKDLYITAFLTGMRLGELLNLQWKEFDIRNKLITIRNTSSFKTKNKKDRVIPVNDELMILLKRRLSELKFVRLDDYIFSKHPGVKYTVDYISKKFKKVVRAAKLNDDIHFHTLRHSFASMLVQKGIPLIVVRDLLGHSDIRTTEIYSHITSANLIDAVKNISIESA